MSRERRRKLSRTQFGANWYMALMKPGGHGPGADLSSACLLRTAEDFLQVAISSHCDHLKLGDQDLLNFPMLWHKPDRPKAIFQTRLFKEIERLTSSFELNFSLSEITADLCRSIPDGTEVVQTLDTQNDINLLSNPVNGGDYLKSQMFR